MVISSKLEITLQIWGSNPPRVKTQKKYSSQQITLLWLKIVDIFQKIIDLTLENKSGNQTGVS
jgi:hypothetical protein